MNAGEGWKKWGAITGCTCMLVFFASPLLLLAEEPAQTDQNAAVPAQKAEEPALTDQQIPASEQKAKGPLPSTQPAPVPEQEGGRAGAVNSKNASPGASGKERPHGRRHDHQR